MAALLKGHIPAQLVIQYTDHCNARCPQCGMNIGNRFPRSRLGGDEIRRIIDAAAARGVGAVSFTGGEPLLFLDELLGYIRYAGRAGIPFIRTGTNGFSFMGAGQPDFRDRVGRLAQGLASTPLRNFWISIDSADPATHEAMRGFPGVIDGIAQALPIFHSQGLYPSANLGLNRNLGGGPLPSLPPDGTAAEALAFREMVKESLRRFYRLVIDLGFTMVNTCYPMSVEAEGDQGLNATYAATSSDQVVRFNRLEKAQLFQALFEVIPEFRKQIRIFSPRTSLRALVHQYSGRREMAHPCRGGVDFFFVDAAQGQTYPCGYRGSEPLGRFGENASLPAESECRRCDWECFRDPSELFGPILDLHRPTRLLRRLAQDRAYAGIWLQDMLYYRACAFFDSRRPPKSRR
jgi:hypothetical protein